MNTSSGNLPFNGESGGNQCINGTSANVTEAAMEPSVYCFVFATLYLVALVFTVAVLSPVVTAKALPHIICFVLANILIACFTAGFGIFVINLAI